MGETHVIADPHLDHRRIALYCERRRWLFDNPNYDPTKDFHIDHNNPIAVDMDRMNEEMIEFWNKRVSKGDLTYVVGDFAYRRHAHFLQALKGKKILIIGNHDKMSQQVYSLFTRVYDFGCRRKVNKQDVTFCHYAMLSWPSSVHGSWCLYGHSHGRMPEWDNRLTFDVGVDVWGYAPIPWPVIVEKMKRKMAARECGDGEKRPIGNYSDNPKQRVIDTRVRNLALLDEMGIEVFVR